MSTETFAQLYVWYLPYSMMLFAIIWIVAFVNILAAKKQVTVKKMVPPVLYSQSTSIIEREVLPLYQPRVFFGPISDRFKLDNAFLGYLKTEKVDAGFLRPSYIIVGHS